MKELFQIPQAKPHTEATICEYLSKCQNRFTCTIKPSECALSILGHVSDHNTFTPLRPTQRRCPKLEKTN